MAQADIQDREVRVVYERAYRIIDAAERSTTVRFGDDGSQFSERRLERGGFTVTEDGLRVELRRGGDVLFRASPDYCHDAGRFMLVPDCREALNALTS